MRSIQSPIAILIALATLVAIPASRADRTPPRPYGLTTRPVVRPYLNMPHNDKGPIPALLSQTGAFKDVRALAPVDGLIPYDLNVPFWSDGAAKLRWAAIPNDGTSAPPRVGFSPTGEWTFPAGTVFVKNFEIATDESKPAEQRRLETRLLVRDDAGGVYGVSYRWREDGSDADRVPEGKFEPVEVRTAAGVRKQNWYYPGPNDCRTCHTPQAGLVLGVKTRQMNRNLVYSGGVTDNQIRGWTHAGLLDPVPDEADIPKLPRLSRADDAHADLTERARSYLDANCAHCHRPGGVAGNFDARFDTPLARQNLLDGPVLIDLGLDRARVIAPGDVWRSVALARIESTEQPKMPPLAHDVIDKAGAALLREWIQSLPGPQVLAPPSILPAGGEFKTAVKVELKHPDPGATIRYTLDGSPPGKTAEVYKGPITVAGPTTVRARAYKDGATRSIVVQETLIVGE